MKFRYLKYVLLGTFLLNATVTFSQIESKKDSLFVAVDYFYLDNGILPDSITKYHYVNNLYIYGLFDSIPPNYNIIIKQLKKIKHIKMLGLRFSESNNVFPKCFCKLNNIKIDNLCLRGQRISKFPKCVKRLTNIKSILLSNTHLGLLSDEELEVFFTSLSRFKNLERIVIWDNELTTLPSSFKKLTKLKIIELGNNRFDGIPSVLGEMQEIKSIRIDYNPKFLESGYFDDFSNIKMFIINIDAYTEEINPINCTIEELIQKFKELHPNHKFFF